MRNYKINFVSGEPITAMTGAYNDGDRPYWKLATAYEVIIEQCRLIIPAGFTTDYASVPRLFWAGLPPTDPLYGPPAILHDFLCSNAILPWNVNADIFMSAMTAMQVNWFKKWCMYDVVRCAGIFNPYSDVDEILGFRVQCGIANLYNFPICQTVEELSAMAKEIRPQLKWAIPV